VISFSFQIVTHPLLRADAWLGVSLCVTKCSFQGGMRITRSIALSLLHFLLFFELVVVNNLIRKTSIYIFFTLPYLFNAKLTFKRLFWECHNSLQKSCMDFFEIQNT
jgi:hypothetical protein